MYFSGPEQHFILGTPVTRPFPMDHKEEIQAFPGTSPGFAPTQNICLPPAPQPFVTVRVFV